MKPIGGSEPTWFLFPLPKNRREREREQKRRKKKQKKWAEGFDSQHFENITK